jgi:mono/diheme cytochrome c family protein
MSKRGNPFTFLFTSAVLAVGILSATACDGGEADPSVAEADKIFKERCVTCHGASGKGDGPGAAALNPKPRSFTDPGWQGSTDDARIKKVIVEGGASVGLSEAMAPNPDLADKPKVQDALVVKIRRMMQ